MMKNLVVPGKFVSQMHPVARSHFQRWAEYMYKNIQFGMQDSVIHEAAHCERVLLYAMLIALQRFADDERAFTILAHAAIFHDTRRVDDGLDTGHGARAAAYYEEFCREHPELTYFPEAAIIMSYHDRSDKPGEAAINETFADSSERVRLLYHILKDADALDRWRLGRYGLDPDYLRTNEAINLIGFARILVARTLPAD